MEYDNSCRGIASQIASCGIERRNTSEFINKVDEKYARFAYCSKRDIVLKQRRGKTYI